MKRKKLLVVFANPEQTVPLELSKEREAILEAIDNAKFEGKIKPTFIEASTVHDLRRALLKEDYQIVHFSLHGTNSGLIFQDAAGEPHQVSPTALADLLKEFPPIECVVLNACHSLSQAYLIANGAADVITMQDRLSDKAAIEFSRGFYDAVGAGKDYGSAYRQGSINVGMMHPDASFPSKFLSKEEYSREAVFIDQNQADSTLGDSAPATSSTDLKVGIPPLPEIFLGRDDDLGILKERLGLLKGGKDSGATQIIAAFPESERGKPAVAAVRGFAGIGKTATAAVLAADADVAEAFPDGIFWASLGLNPNPIYTMAKWGEELGTEEIYGAPTLREAVERLSKLFREKRILMVIDDVWEAEHAIPFKQARGQDCSLLIATRAPQIISELSILPEAVHNLPPLTEQDSLNLLEILAPTVVPDYLQDCLELVRFLGCLPLALHVAGRLLNEESREVWGVEGLLKSLREGKMLIEAKVPADLMDYEKQTIPSVAALLRKSIDTLDPEAQRHFAYLAPYAEEPATFDLEALQASWDVEDPKPIIRRLTGRGLLEPVGKRYQMHSLLVALADALLNEL